MELIKSKFHENKDWNCSQGIRISFFHSHQEQVPRKQGLKRFGVVASGAPSDPIKSKFHENKDWNKMCIRGPFPAIRASRASSTKTRIETPMRPFASKTRFPSRASSTKTRIETSALWLPRWARSAIKSKFHENKDWNGMMGNMSDRPYMPIKSKFHENKDWNAKDCPANYIHHRHQEQVPRKQGLKRFLQIGFPQIGFPSRASSTKTRIETSGCCNVVWPPGPHQEQVPRKQGLKLHTLIVILCFAKSSRASSTKTRIETWWGSMTIFKDQASRASSTKTRIETPMSPGRGSHVTDGKPVILSRPC